MVLHSVGCAVGGGYCRSGLEPDVAPVTKQKGLLPLPVCQARTQAAHHQLKSLVPSASGASVKLPSRWSTASSTAPGQSVEAEGTDRVEPVLWPPDALAKSPPKPSGDCRGEKWTGFGGRPFIFLPWTNTNVPW